MSGELTLSLKNNGCLPNPFLVECRTLDVVNPIGVQVAFFFDGILTESKLKPELASSSARTINHPLNFEIDCGADGVCTDDIHLSVNFSGSIIEVGITQEIGVVVTVENRGEDSYNTRVSLRYPPGLSYRTLATKQGRVECSVTVDSTAEASPEKTECSVNRPILRAGDKAVFVVQYGIVGDSDFRDIVTMQAQAFSNNDKHATGSHLSKTLDIAVKYSIYVILKRFEGTSSYINFTAGNYHLQKPVTNHLEVTNRLRDLNLTVIIHVPVKLQDKNIWTNADSLHIKGCTRGQELNPVTTDLKQTFKNNKEPTLNCSIALCLEFRCASFMTKGSQNRYSISGNVSSGWIEQTGLRSALFYLVTSATLEYDNNKYIFYSSESSRQPPVTRIQTHVEVYEEPNLTKEIIGGGVIGLILLALLTAALVKSGFFKSSYQQRLQETGNEDQEGGEPPEAEA
ncbi:hypothetical protein ACEWY4_003674 [Coilia grayii]|uniref:Integrin alpha-M-like n=1 Tax=Coilia grayii TaxID=363190 RepID=A0ABD1KT14_9TELE